MIDTLLRLAKKAGCGDAEVFVQSVVSDSSSAEKGVINETTSASLSGVGLRVNFGGKAGFSFGTLSQAGRHFPERLVENAVSSAGVGEGFLGFPERQKYNRIAGQVDRRIVNATTSGIIDMTRDMLSVLKTFGKKGLRPTSAGVSRTLYGHTVANTNGVFISERASEIGCGAYVTIGTVVGWKSKESRKLEDMDFGEVALDAARKAFDALHPKKISGGEMDVVLRPECLGGEEGLLGGTMVEALNGENAFRKSSRLAGKIGQEIFSENATVVDDGLLPHGLNTWSADTEGVASRRTVLVENGVLRSFMHDTSSAARAKTESTANGYRDYASVPSIHPSNLILMPGRAGEEEMVRDIGEGLLVNWLSGAHTANGFSGDFSVEAKNAFYVKGGKILYPVKSAMLSGNVFSMMEDCECASNLEHLPGGISAPSLKVKLNVVA